MACTYITSLKKDREDKSDNNGYNRGDNDNSVDKIELDNPIEDIAKALNNDIRYAIIEVLHPVNGDKLSDDDYIEKYAMTNTEICRKLNGKYKDSFYPQRVSPHLAILNDADIIGKSDRDVNNKEVYYLKSGAFNKLFLNLLDLIH